MVRWVWLFFALVGLSLTAADGQVGKSQPVRQAIQQGAKAMSAGIFSQAVESYRQVTRIQPEFSEGYFNLGLADEQARQLDEAHTALEKALVKHQVLKFRRAKIRELHRFSGSDPCFRWRIRRKFPIQERSPSLLTTEQFNPAADKVSKLVPA
jgi:tetratricopeptide (TPR) repeat protein